MSLWRGVKHHGVVLESVAYQISSVYRFFFLLFFKRFSYRKIVSNVTIVIHTVKTINQSFFVILIDPESMEYEDES
jgi:hypothetical protein